MIAIVDYGMGNVRSLRNAFDYGGHRVVVTGDPRELDAADRIVLPGVGAFGDAMEAIRARGLTEVLARQVLEFEKPLLGICLGMHLLCRSSVEHGRHLGLGWLDADVQPLTVSPPLKVPHVGWNDIRFLASDLLFRGIRPKEANFYFAHSYHASVDDPGEVIASAEHGAQIAAVVRSGNLTGAQFHPEKSQDNGLQFLENWVASTL